LIPQQQIAPKHDNVADFYEDVSVIYFAIARKQGILVLTGCNADAGAGKNLLLQEQIASTGRRLSCFRGTPG
jgi:predicted small secreted protein